MNQSKKKVFAVLMVASMAIPTGMAPVSDAANAFLHVLWDSNLISWPNCQKIICSRERKKNSSPHVWNVAVVLIVVRQTVLYSIIYE